MSSSLYSVHSLKKKVYSTIVCTLSVLSEVVTGFTTRSPRTVVVPVDPERPDDRVVPESAGKRACSCCTRKLVLGNMLGLAGNGMAVNGAVPLFM